METPLALITGIPASLHVIEEIVVLLFVHNTANQQCQGSKADHNQMQPPGRNNAVDHHTAEILDCTKYRIDIEHILDIRRIAVYRIEDSRHVHQKHGQDIVEILNIPEKDVQRRKNQANADVEKNQINDRINQRDEFPGERHTVNSSKYKENHQIEAKVDNGGYIF